MTAPGGEVRWEESRDNGEEEKTKVAQRRAPSRGGSEGGTPMTTKAPVDTYTGSKRRYLVACVSRDESTRSNASRADFNCSPRRCSRRVVADSPDPQASAWSTMISHLICYIPHEIFVRFEVHKALPTLEWLVDPLNCDVSVTA